MNTMMSKDDVIAVLKAHGETDEWLDPIIPAHLKRILRRGGGSA